MKFWDASAIIPLCIEEQKTPLVQDIALQSHPLRAADSLQLAAAIVWADKTPKGHQFVCFDLRLRDAAATEGFTVLPENM